MGLQLPPYFTNDPMEGDPPCQWVDFMTPKLRRFPRSNEQIHWKKKLGHGGEGVVACVRFGDDHDNVYALKVFYRTGPLPSSVGNEHGSWSLRSEALTVATLNQVCAGLRNAAPLPVFVPSRRISRLDALSSLYACSAEGRQSDVYAKLPEQDRTSLSDLFAATRIRRCFGWVRLGGDAVVHLNRGVYIDARRRGKGELQPTHFESGKHYYGIVYEYIPPRDFDVDAMQRQIDFFYYAGFRTCQPANKVNWQGPGIKLDFGDFRTPIDPWFEGHSYYIRPTQAWFILDLDDPEPELSTQEVDEIDREHCALGDIGEEVELTYCARYYVTGSRRFRPGVGHEELGDHLLHSIRVPEIEPLAMRKVWKEHRKAKKEYLAWLAEVEGGNGAPSGGAERSDRF